MNKKNNLFKLRSHYTPAGDQPKAITYLTDGLKECKKHQTLLGATGTGKTFSMANVIEKIQRPTLVIAHNKTLAAQLSQEYSEFFPENAVHYFVSYYDFYQPEAYMPITDTYIEKEAQINEEIDRLRHAATQSLLTRRDVIVVASVSCIYGLGSPAEYEKVNLKIEKGASATRAILMRRLIKIYYERTGADLSSGSFRAVGNSIEIMPASEEAIYRIEFKGELIKSIFKIDAMTRAIKGERDNVYIFPAKHYVTPEDERLRALQDIELELKEQLEKFQKQGKVLENERLKRRTNYDMAMIREVGYCNGIENYSRHFDGRKEGEPPYTLLDYFPRDFLTIIDESHVTIPQIRSMYAGDRSRKETLIEHGFRLPSAKDNRPLTFDEYEKKVGQRIYTSATPGPYELERGGVAEQIIRPTGLVDPHVEVRPIIASLNGSYGGQIQDFIKESEAVIKRGGRVIATTLTKKMAEDMSQFLKERKIKAEYLHSDIKTIERIQILTQFRKGVFDILVGVNLLREGLDLPEVAFIGIMDSDKEGFLRSETSLIQIIGRAARNVYGRVILYADKMTGSIERALKETNRRREIQLRYNSEHNITPKTIIKSIKDITERMDSKRERISEQLLREDLKALKDKSKVLREKKRQMKDAVKVLDFETAAILRDEIALLEKLK